MAAAHERGLVHRDFKPDNVMIADDGGVKVVDFGLARRDAEPGDVARFTEGGDEVKTDATRGTILGTPAYMAPEQLSGRTADARSDQFAFCAALYEAVQGERPFEGDSLTEIKSNVERGASADRRRWTGPGWLSAIVRRGLHKEPDRRWPDMPSLLAAIRRGRRRRARLAGGAATVLAVGGIALAAIYNAETPVDPAQDGCAPASELLEDVWDDGVRVRLRERFDDDPYPYSRPAYAILEAELDETASDWAAAWDQACRPDNDPRIRLRSQDCLEQGRQRLRFLGGSLGLSPVNLAVAGMPETVALLPDPRECLDPAIVESTPRPPDEDEQAEVAALRGALLLSYAREAKTSEEIAAIYDPLVKQAESLRYPILAEVLAIYATRLADRRLVELRAVSDRAIDVAERTRHDRALATVLARRAAAEVGQGSFDSVAESFRRAEVALDRSGRPIEIQVRVLRTQASFAVAERRFDDAREFVRRAKERVEQRYGDRDGRLLVLELGELEIAAASHDLDALVQAIERVSTIGSDALAAGHPASAWFHRERARVAFESGDRQEAKRQWDAMEAALARGADSNGRPDPWVQSSHDLNLIEDFYGLFRCEEGKRALSLALTRAEPRWELELHAAGVLLAIHACLDLDMAFEHAKAAMSLIDGGRPSSSVRAGQIIAALMFSYEQQGREGEAEEFRDRARAYAGLNAQRSTSAGCMAGFRGSRTWRTQACLGGANNPPGGGLDRAGGSGRRHGASCAAGRRRA